MIFLFTSVQESDKLKGKKKFEKRKYCAFNDTKAATTGVHLILYFKFMSKILLLDSHYSTLVEVKIDLLLNNLQLHLVVIYFCLLRQTAVKSHSCQKERQINHSTLI
jgi:hypothetical protein